MMKKTNSKLLKILSAAFVGVSTVALSLAFSIGSVFTAKADGISVDSLITVQSGGATVTAGKTNGYNGETGLTVSAKDGEAYSFGINGVFKNDTRLDVSFFGDLINPDTGKIQKAKINNSYFAFQIADAANPDDYFLIEVYPNYNGDAAGSLVYLNYQGSIRFTGRSGAMGLVDTIKYHGATYSPAPYDATVGTWAKGHNANESHYQRNTFTALQLTPDVDGVGVEGGSYLTIRYDGDVMEIVVPRLAIKENGYSYWNVGNKLLTDGEQVVARFDGTTEIKNGKTSVRANQYNLPKLDWDGYTIRGISKGTTDIALQKITTGTNTATQDTTSTPDFDGSDGKASCYTMTSTWSNETEVSLTGTDNISVPNFMANAMSASYIEFASKPVTAVKAGTALEISSANFVNYATGAKVAASVSVSNGGEFTAVNGTTYTPATAGDYTLRYTAGENKYDVKVAAYDYTPVTEEGLVTATAGTVVTSATDNAIRGSKTSAGLLIDGPQNYQADINGIFKGDTRIDFTPTGLEDGKDYASGDIIFRITDAKTGTWYEVVFWSIGSQSGGATWCAVYDGSKYITAHNTAPKTVYTGSRADIQSKGGNNAKTRIYSFQGDPTHVTLEWYGDVLVVFSERQNWSAGCERIIARFDGTTTYGLPKVSSMKTNGYTISVRSTDSKGSAVVLNTITNNATALVLDGDNIVSESPAFYNAQADLSIGEIGANNTVVYGANNNTYELATVGGSGAGAVSYSVISGPATVNGNVLTVTGAGEVVLQAKKASDGTYLATYATTTLTVGKAEQASLAINAINNGQITLGNNNSYELGTTGGNGTGAVTYTVVSGPATVSGNVLTVTGAGNVVVKATKAGDDNYNEATSAEYTLAVAKGTRELTISGIAATVKFGANNNAYTLSCGVEGVVYTVVSGPATVSGNVLTVMGAGTISIKADLAENADYYAATTTVDVTVVKGEQSALTITGIDASVTYTVNTFTLATTGGNGNGAVSYAITAGNNATLEGATLTLTTAGTFTITATKAGDENYNAATATLEVTVVKAEQATLVISGIDTEIRYSETNNVYAIVVTGGSTDAVATIVSSDNLLTTVDGLNVTVLGVGSFTITATKAGDDKYNEATATFEVNVLKSTQDTLTIQAIGTNNTVVYGDNENTYTLAVNGGNGTGAVTYTLVSGPAVLDGDVLTITGAGEVVLVATKAGNANYEAATSAEYTLTVQKKAQATLVLAPIVEGNEITFNAENNTYTLTVSGGTGTGELYFVVKSGPATVEGNILTVTGEGTIIVYAVKEGNANMAEAVSAEVTLVVKAAETPEEPGIVDKVKDILSGFGCNASISGSFVALLTCVGAGAGVILRKKRED